MKKSKTNVPVYMIFFNRPDTLKKVFESVKEARPAQLFLACDGPRVGRQDDIENVKKCKEIVEDIDWECEVHKNYSDVNLGCGMRMYSGVSWAFEYVDRLIIVEDDCVLSQDFYPFCEELLERYKDDDRIHTISAMNHLGIYEKTPNSYFFSRGCCWGWATWKRAWKYMDYDMSFIDDVYSVKCVEALYPYRKNALNVGISRKEILTNGGKLSAWTYQNGMASALQNQCSIVPKVNLVTNIGLTEDSGHATNNIKKVPKRHQAYFNQETLKMEFPLKHPQYVIEDRMYYDEVTRKFKTTVFTRIESIVRKIIYADKYEIKGMTSKIAYKLKIKRKA